MMKFYTINSINNYEPIVVLDSIDSESNYDYNYSLQLHDEITQEIDSKLNLQCDMIFVPLWNLGTTLQGSDFDHDIILCNHRMLSLAINMCLF